MTKTRLALLFFLALASIAIVRHFALGPSLNIDPSKDAALNEWIARNVRDPEYQRLRRLDRTPGTGGILVNEKEVLPPLVPPGAAAAMNRLAPIGVQDRAEKAVIFAPSDGEIRQQVR